MERVFSFILSSFGYATRYRAHPGVYTGRLARLFKNLVTRNLQVTPDALPVGSFHITRADGSHSARCGQASARSRDRSERARQDLWDG